jgi:hypothetical protein
MSMNKYFVDDCLIGRTYYIFISSSKYNIVIKNNTRWNYDHEVFDFRVENTSRVVKDDNNNLKEINSKLSKVLACINLTSMNLASINLSKDILNLTKTFSTNDDRVVNNSNLMNEELFEFINEYFEFIKEKDNKLGK